MKIWYCTTIAGSSKRLVSWTINGRCHMYFILYKVYVSIRPSLPRYSVKTIHGVSLKPEEYNFNVRVVNAIYAMPFKGRILSNI